MAHTDLPQDGAVRVSTTLTRFHVGAPEHGLVEAFRRRADAFECACRYANKEGVMTTVFDSMARRGAGELWEFYPSPDGGLVTWKQPSRRRAL